MAVGTTVTVVKYTDGWVQVAAPTTAFLCLQANCRGMYYLYAGPSAPTDVTAKGVMLGYGDPDDYEPLIAPNGIAQNLYVRLLSKDEGNYVDTMTFAVIA